MSIREARRAILHAQLEMDRCDPEALREAVKWTTRALTHLFDAQNAAEKRSQTVDERPVDG